MLSNLKQKIRNIWLKSKWYHWLIPATAIVGIGIGFIPSPVPISTIQVIRFEKGIKFQRPNGKGIARIFTAPIHFKKSGQWTSIQDGFVDKGTFIDFGDTPFHVNLPKQFNGQHKFITDSGESFFFNPSGGNASIPQLIDKGYKDIDGNPQMVLKYHEAFNGVDVEYDGSWAGIETTFTIKSATSAIIAYNLEPDNQGITTQGINEINIQETGKVVSKIHKPLAKNKNGKDIAVKIKITTMGAGKHIEYRVSGVASDYPIKIDPLQRFCNTTISSPCAQISTVDGSLRVDRINATWATMRNAANADVTQKTAAQPVHYCWNGDNGASGSRDDSLSRSVFQFDTGNGGMSTVSSSSLQMAEAASASGAGAPGLRYAPSFFNSSSTNDLITTNFPNASDTRAANLISYNTGAGTQYDSFLIYSTSTTSFVSATTTTKIMMRCDNDFDNQDNNTLNAADSFGLNMSETTGVTDDPQLIVDYTAAVAAAAPAPNNKYLPGFMGWLINKVYASNSF